MKRTEMKRIGKRGHDWRRIREWSKPKFEAKGRTFCEFDFISHECSPILDFAHSKKRRMMIGNDIYMFALACRQIHDILDGVIPHPTLGRFDHQAMQAAVELAIMRNGGPIVPERT